MTINDEQDSLCELAALYSLGSLDDLEERRFESHLLDGCPKCEEELAADDQVVALLAFAATPANPPEMVRETLLEIADALPRPEVILRQYEGLIDKLPWVPAPVPGMAFKSPTDQVTHNNTPTLSIDVHNVQHLVARIHCDVTEGALSFHRLVCANEKLLARLAGSIKSSLHLRASE